MLAEGCSYLWLRMLWLDCGVQVPGETEETEVAMAGRKTVESMRAVSHVTVM